MLSASRDELPVALQVSPVANDLFHATAGDGHVQLGWTSDTAAKGSHNHRGYIPIPGTTTETFVREPHPLDLIADDQINREFFYGQAVLSRKNGGVVEAGTVTNTITSSTLAALNFQLVTFNNVLESFHASWQTSNRWVPEFSAIDERPEAGRAAYPTEGLAAIPQQLETNDIWYVKASIGWPQGGLTGQLFLLVQDNTGLSQRPPYVMARFLAARDVAQQIEAVFVVNQNNFPSFSVFAAQTTGSDKTLTNSQCRFECLRLGGF